MSERSRATRLAEERRHDLNRRLRAEFEGAEERSRKGHGRGPTDEELRRIIHRYPGDLPEG